MTKEQISEKHFDVPNADHEGICWVRADWDHILEAMAEYANIREQYWKERCLAAEDFIKASPCDPDITPAQVKAHEKWSQLVHNQFIEQQNKDNGRG